MKYLVFGDSHTLYFNITESMKCLDQNLRGIQSIVKTIGGSTISGFGKRDSTLDTLHTYKKAYETVKPDYIVFALGQVDLELGYFYRWFIKKERPDTNSYIDKLTSSLINEVVSICKMYDMQLSQFIIKGVNLSVLTYDRNLAIKYTSGIITENIAGKELSDEIKKAMITSYPSNLERAHMHLEFNKQLKEKAIDANLKYFDINTEITINGTSQVKPEYVPAKYDHHLVDSLEVRLVHVKKLLETIWSK